MTDSNDMMIEATEGGPFMAHNVTVRGADYVRGADDTAITWSFGEAYESGDEPVALCRCGQSSNRPFCDGSHQDAEWDSSDAHDPDRPYAERARRTQSPTEGYELLDDTKLCMHAGQCATAKETVWQMMKSTDDSSIRGQVIRMVEKCPSGRLSNVIDGSVAEPALPAEVNVIPGGPLWVTGGIAVKNGAGEQLEIRNRVTLCRCGASSNKPLCDGSHADIEFEGVS